MKKYKLLSYLILFYILGLTLAGCDDNMEVAKEIGVKNVELKKELVDGIILEIGATTNISRKVILTPENATDRAENYSSSDPEVATVSASGEITGNSIGTCNIIITVGGKSVEFLLSVIPKTTIPLVKIELAISSPLSIKVGESFNLSEQVVKHPITSNEEVVYTSSDSEIVTISDAGLLTGAKEGNATITVASKGDPSINTELDVIVTAKHIDHSRSGWTIVNPASHRLPITGSNAEGNSFLAALDGNLGTNLCMVRPGKKYGTAPDRAEPAIGEAIYFTVDMLEPRTVSYFRIRHRDETQLFLRWNGFDQILGSNDGVNFDIIATDVVVPNVEISAIESPDIKIPTSEYRYIKFYAVEAKCFHQGSYTSQGSTVQIQELYLGYSE